MSNLEKKNKWNMEFICVFIANLYFMLKFVKKIHCKMIKQRLILVRKNRKLSQAYIAKALCMDTSNYNRREKGEVKISYSEWKKLANILEVSLDDILEEDTPQIFISSNSIGDKVGITHYHIPLSLWEIQKKYIQKLEQENQDLRFYRDEKKKNNGV